MRERKSSPLVIGVGQDNEFFIGSDATPIVAYTKNVIYLEDEEVATMHRNGELVIRTIGDAVVTPEVHAIEMEIASLEKGGYDHFMLKEIFEQPKSIRDSIRGRVSLQAGETNVSGIDDHWTVWSRAKRILVLGCGTSWHAGLVGEYLFESLARIPVEVEYASEFRYRNPIIREDDVVLAISQSGETADTLAAIRLAKAQGAHVFGICNVVGSSIARETHAGAYTHAGPEIGVASTKAFVGSVACLSLIAGWFAQNRSESNVGKALAGKSSPFHRHEQKRAQLIDALHRMPTYLGMTLRTRDQCKAVAEKLKDKEHLFVLGKGLGEPIAKEGALKIKEITYLHAEGYGGGSLKHGPFALLEKGTPIVLLVLNDQHAQHMRIAAAEVRARGAYNIIITDKPELAEGIADDVISIPSNGPMTALLGVVPLQLIAYELALKRGIDPDKPRHLAKAVTVD